MKNSTPVRQLKVTFPRPRALLNQSARVARCNESPLNQIRQRATTVTPLLMALLAENSYGTSALND